MKPLIKLRLLFVFVVIMLGLITAAGQMEEKKEEVKPKIYFEQLTELQEDVQAADSIPSLGDIFGVIHSEDDSEQDRPGEEQDRADQEQNFQEPDKPRAAINETSRQASLSESSWPFALDGLNDSAFTPINQQRLNKETDNLNVLFVGVGDGELKMVCLYSIDYQETWRSAAMFFPNRTTVGLPGRDAGSILAGIYEAKGVEGLVKALEDKLEVSINYYIKVDRKVLQKVAAIIDPIYVEGEQVDITTLFDMKVTPHDDYILGELVKQFRKPAVYFFALPELFFSFRKYISTDFAITPTNLYFHFKVASGINPSLLTKTIVSGWNYHHQGEWVWVIPEDTWKNIVHRLTK
jgi:hypothetical protein